MSAQVHGIDKIPGVLGYLVLNEDGAVANSSGELRNTESLSDPVLAMLRTLQRGKFVICKDQEFQTIQVYAANAVFLIFRQNQKIYVLKKRIELDQSAL